MPITASKAPRESSSVRAMKLPAALLTRTSSGPSFQISSTMASTRALSRTSQTNVLTVPPVKTFVCDVRDSARVEAMVDEIWNDGPLDVLVNNAAGNFIARTEELSLGAFEAVIGIVLMGTLHVTLACGRRWLKQGHHASVLSITTTYAESGSAYVVPSSVANTGVLNPMLSLAVEWGPRGIRLNAIAPGPIPTDGSFSLLMPLKSLDELAKKRNPLGRFGTHEELANLAPFLVSDQSGYVTGPQIVIDLDACPKTPTH